MDPMPVIYKQYLKLASDQTNSFETRILQLDRFLYGYANVLRLIGSDLS